jgi:hypothetical protein
MTAVTPVEPIGAPMMLRIARRWNGAPVRAVALVRRPDSLKRRLAWHGCWAPRLYMPRVLRDAPAPTVDWLAGDPLLLVLEPGGTLHLLTLASGALLLHASAAQRTWAPGEVVLAIEECAERKQQHPVTLTESGGVPQLLAAPWRSRRQRAALELIAQRTEVQGRGPVGDAGVPA